MANSSGSETSAGDMRQRFWLHVMREILTSLSVSCLERRSAGPPKAEDVDLFDGRMAVLTHAGERIPIAEVHPLFACGIPTSEGARALSMAVECSVFQIRTPSGEVFTLPLHEMRGFHSMSAELMEALESQAKRLVEPDGDEPFGFAAFTSLSREREEE